MQQLDIFADSRDRVLLNTLADALTGNDRPAAPANPLDAGRCAAAAQAAWATWATEFPDDRLLLPAQALIRALQAETQAGDTAWGDTAQAVAACVQLEHTISPAAVAVLGRDAAAPWLQARWRALAHRARALPFVAPGAARAGGADTAAQDAPLPCDGDATGAAAATPAAATPDGAAPATAPPAPPWCAQDVHAAPLWLRARDWAAAADAVQRIESWRHKPVPLGWMAQAVWHRDGLDAAWPLLAELAWRAPRRLPTLLQALPDHRLHKAARRFEAALDDEPADWAWWPAWLLVEQPLLAPVLQAAQATGHSAPERGHALLQALLRLERQGRHGDRVAHRRELQALHPGLYRAYMSTR